MKLKETPSGRFGYVLSLFLGLACCGFVILNYRSRLEVEKLTTEIAKLRVELNGANQRPGSAAVEKRKLAMRQSDHDAESTAPFTSSLEVPPGSAKPESKRRVDTEAMSSLVKSPMMQKIMASQTTAVLQMTYGRLMDHLELSGEEREYLQRLLVEKQTNLQNLGMQLMNPGLSGDDRSAIMTNLTEAWKSGEAKIREFLNDEADYAYYQIYNKQEPERKEVGMFEGSLKEGELLDAATSDALANLQSESRKNFPFTVDFYNQENFGKPGILNSGAVQTFLDEQTKFQAGVAEKAADLLSPAQLQVYKQNQAAVRQMANMQLNSIIQMVGIGR